MKGILDYWFGDPVERVPGAERNRLWFNARVEQDREMRLRFGDLVEQAIAGELQHWLIDAPGYLATVLLLDQMPRNIWRGTSRAFSGDPRALITAKQAIEAGLDRSLPVVQRIFLYLPFEHQESLCEQDRCVALLDAAMAELDGAQRELAKSYGVHAREHREIILRFGRFPHRNAILSRTSTPEELAYLEAGAKSFGQK